MSFPDITFFAAKISGGMEGAMDTIGSGDLVEGNRVFVVTEEITEGFSVYYVYLIDISSSIAEASPLVVQPDCETGDKRWIYSPLFDPHVREITLTENAGKGYAIKADGALADAPDRHKAIGVALYAGNNGETIHITTLCGIARDITPGKNIGQKAYIQANGSIDDESNVTDYPIGIFLNTTDLLVTKNV